MRSTRLLPLTTPIRRLMRSTNEPTSVINATSRLLCVHLFLVLHLGSCLWKRLSDGEEGQRIHFSASLPFYCRERSSLFLQKKVSAASVPSFILSTAVFFETVVKSKLTPHTSAKPFAAQESPRDHTPKSAKALPRVPAESIGTSSWGRCRFAFADDNYWTLLF